MGLESKDTYTIGAEGNCSPTYYHVQDENLEQEVNANEVNLDSFKKEKQLADKIWFGDTLNSRVRLKLLDIADDFWDFTFHSSFILDYIFDFTFHSSFMFIFGDDFLY